MKKSAIMLAAVIGMGAAMSASAFPSLGADTAPDVIINWNGTTATVLFNQNNGPYDSIEDTYIGVNNNSSTALNSLTLTGNGIFGFDGDGQAAYTGNYYDLSGYAGPNTSFTIFNNNSGIVNFIGGLAAGQSAWFTLEENINGQSTGSGGGFTVGVPDGGSTMLLLSGVLAGIGALRRRFVS
jgi:hypothetical protein